MDTGAERRCDPRIPVGWPTVLMTPRCAVKGRTTNISVSGLAFFVFLYSPGFGAEFQINLKSPEDHEIPVACEKIWSDEIFIDGFTYLRIAARFLEISSSDREIIASMVEGYFQNYTGCHKYVPFETSSHCCKAKKERNAILKTVINFKDQLFHYVFRQI